MIKLEIRKEKVENNFGVLKQQYVSEYARSHRHIQGFYIGFVNVYIDTQCYINMGSLCPMQTLTEILSYVVFFLRYLRTKYCIKQKQATFSTIHVYLIQIEEEPSKYW